jgi:NTP pyrophosphatase (non-canonical NTP hydrolase)
MEPTPDAMSLERLWSMQAALNARAGVDTRAIGQALCDAEACGDAQALDDALLEAGRAVKKYVDAMSAECHELHDCLSWKHWYQEAREGRQYALADAQNARVEVTDMLFFWISLCQVLGMDVEDVFRLYDKKLGINHRRQDEGRRQSEHGRYEGENRDVV